MLHFAYGSNMSRRIMHRHAPEAVEFGVAALSHYRFVITADGYASLERGRTEVVYGVLWRLTPRDRATLDVWENVAGGLYRPVTLPVQQDGRHRPALTYLARPGRLGRARAGYVELIVASALEWKLPPTYIASLRQWLPKRADGAAGPRKVEDSGWT